MDIERIEIDLLLEAIQRRYGYDFRGYARASLERRIAHFLEQAGCASAGELIPLVLHDEALFTRLLGRLSIPVTELFRDPEVYRALREQVIPVLRTWPHVKIWHVGCATGEEVYSFAIVLRETGLYERATIYATDFNEEALARARAGIYPIERFRDASESYLRAGGTASLSDYYHAAYEAAVMDASLRERILFANHNLVSDSVFGEMHLVFCRNVLIYFQSELRERVLGLLGDSLVHGGFLCLGTKETLQFSSADSAFETLDRNSRLYKKRAPTCL